MTKFSAYQQWRDGGGGVSRMEITGGDDPVVTSNGGSRDRGDAYSRVSAGSESGVYMPPMQGFTLDPDGGSVTVSSPGQPATAPPQTPAPPLNLGWNSGAHSLEVLPVDWVGTISFDVPDVQGSRPGGAAVGLALASQAPVVGRAGYAHLRYGVVFTIDKVKVIFDQQVTLEIPYATVRAARSATGTDTVVLRMSGSSVVLLINDATRGAGVFNMPGPYVLDATLYTTHDSVDNPKFEAGPLADTAEDMLIIAVPAPTVALVEWEGAELRITVPTPTAKLAESTYGELVAVAPAPTMQALMTDESGAPGGTGMALLTITVPKPTVLLSELAQYAELVVVAPAPAMVAAASVPDADVSYLILNVMAPSPTMVMDMGPFAELVVNVPAPEFVAAEVDHAELVVNVPAPRMVAYSGSLTPLVQVMEIVGWYLLQEHVAHVAVSFIEHVNGTATLQVFSTVSVTAQEQVGAQEQLDVLTTLLELAMEQVALGERVTSAVYRQAGDALVDPGEAWVVHAENNATTRYDSYGFNSFAAVGGKHFGARKDGVYLLDGTDDAGRAIASGVALGVHDFGTQALKHLDAVYAGVSSTGGLFIKVGDGVKSYTYKARRKDDRMRVQRFDIGRGIRTNYFTFDLTSDADAFELDSVTFHVLATQRRI